jgi:hypothetical protein
VQQLESTTAIEAPRERVWAVLMDFERYPEWNPFVSRISGRAEFGERLDVRLTPPGGMAMSFKPTVMSVEPQRELRWLGKLLVHGLFDGEHAFELQADGPNRTHFRQTERFTGLLVPLLMLFAGKSTRRGFEAMNQARKHRAEEVL